LPIRQDIGQLWENYLISERLKKNMNENSDKNAYFWRTYNKQEIDLVETTGDKISAFEIKWGNKEVKVPSAFSENYPTAKFQVLNRTNYLEFI
jgi:hypothetical protein